MPENNAEAPIIDPQRSSVGALTYRVDFIDNWERLPGGKPFCASLSDHLGGFSVVGFGDNAFEAVADLLEKAAGYIRMTKLQKVA